MPETATITVTRGPDRGKSFEISDDLIHIGRGAANQIPLDDPSIADHQASIVSRNGRYAIYTPLDNAVNVDGSVIPSERWIWLPGTAHVRIGKRTEFEFSYEPTGSESPPGDDNAASADDVIALTAEEPDKSPASQPPADQSPAGQPRKKSRRRDTAKRAAKSADNPNRQVARFLTNQGGDSLVKLGEDGNLPELTLLEDANPKARKKEKSQSNPMVLYLGVAFSLLFSTLLMFMDVDDGTVSASDLVRARREIEDFYRKKPDEELMSYQKLLRNARLARSLQDTAQERRLYDQVLDMLDSEDLHPELGLTGRPRDSGELGQLSDERLRRLIGTLISE
jgi:hypothetical protein